MNRLLRFLFLGEVDPVFKIRRTIVKASKGDAHPPDETPEDRQNKFKLVMLISWILSLAFLICLIAAIILSYNSRPVPDFLIFVIGGVMGYFGGAFSVYFGLKPR